MCYGIQFAVSGCFSFHQVVSEIDKWRELYCFQARNTYLLPFKSELVGCFKGVVVCLSCIWFLRIDMAFLLMMTWQP